MAETLEIEQFIKRLSGNKLVLLDARSESEYNHGHIPGAINLPLLNDEHRKIVGTTYKQKGREAAVISGFDLAGGKFGDFVRTAIELSAGHKEVMLYCWRGGMRSGIMAWLLHTAGFKVTLLKGGYKSFRKWSLDQFNNQKNIMIIGGRTGTGKTELLRVLKAKGEQVIDLEALANHKGSAFGGLGEKPQPKVEHFENQLAMEWSSMDPDKILWMENESILIGTVKIPNEVFELMRSAPVIEIRCCMETRMNRILHDYGSFALELLAANTSKLTKRLGDERTRKAIEALLNDDKKTWMEETLAYYDKTYDYGMSLRNQENYFQVDSDEAISMHSLAEKVMAMASQHIKQTA